MKQKRYSPKKELLLFLLIWPISAISLLILIMGISFFHQFIGDIKEFLSSNNTGGLMELLKLLIFIPYIIYDFIKSLIIAMETLAQGSNNFGFNILVQIGKYFLMFGWVIALGIFYRRYYKNCLEEQLKKMKHPNLFYYTPLIIVVICLLFLLLYLK